MNEDKLLTKYEVMDYLNISRRHFEKLVMEEDLPIIKITQNKRYMRLSDLNRYLNTKMINKPQDITQESQPDFQRSNIGQTFLELQFVNLSLFIFNLIIKLNTIMKFYYKLQFDKTDVEKSPSVQDLKTKIDEKYSLEYHQQIDLDSSLNKEEIIERINKHALKEEKVKVEIHGVEKFYFGLSDWLTQLIIWFELEEVSSTFDSRYLDGLEYITEHVKLVLIVEELGIETELSVTDFCNV